METFEEYQGNTESHEAFLALLMYQIQSEPYQPSPPQNRRRSLSADNLGLYEAYLGMQATPNRRRSSMLPSHLPPRRPEAQLLQPNSEQITDTIQYGLLNLIRPIFNTATQRTDELAQTVRLNMINSYLKYMIQALLYILVVMLAYALITLCAKCLGFLIVPIALIWALHSAARGMHQPNNQLHIPNSHQTTSLATEATWTHAIHAFIDKTANYSLGFFSDFATSLANSSLLDRQITHIPDNSYNLGR